MASEVSISWAGGGVTCGCLWVGDAHLTPCLVGGGSSVGGRYNPRHIWFPQRKADQDDLSSVEAAKVKRQFVLGCWQALGEDERVKWHKTQTLTLLNATTINNQKKSKEICDFHFRSLSVSVF